MTTLPSEYWPRISRVQQLYNSAEVVIEQHATYQKQSAFNRCHITGVHGVVTLSIPLAGGREQKAFEKDIRIDSSQCWAIQHLRTLQSCYGKAPFFDYYFPVVEHILQQPFTHVSALNEAILSQIMLWLQWKGQLQKTDTFIRNVDSAPPPTQKTYVQVFADRQPFIQDASILDAFFCLGPQIKAYLNV